MHPKFIKNLKKSLNDTIGFAYSFKKSAAGFLPLSVLLSLL